MTHSFNDIWFRTERQTLRRMPKTGCILFTIRCAIPRALIHRHSLLTPSRLPQHLLPQSSRHCQRKGRTRSHGLCHPRSSCPRPSFPPSVLGADLRPRAHTRRVGPTTSRRTKEVRFTQASCCLNWTGCTRNSWPMGRLSWMRREGLSARGSILSCRSSWRKGGLGGNSTGMLLQISSPRRAPRALLTPCSAMSLILSLSARIAQLTA